MYTQDQQFCGGGEIEGEDSMLVETVAAETHPVVLVVESRARPTPEPGFCVYDPPRQTFFGRHPASI